MANGIRDLPKGYQTEYIPIIIGVNGHVKGGTFEDVGGAGDV